MRLLFLLLVPSLAFAILAVAAYARRGLRAVLLVAFIWVAAVSVYTVASLPPPHQQVHSFERSPIPGIAWALAGAAAATALVIQRRGGEQRRAVLVLEASLLYTVASVLAGVGAFLIVAG